MRNIDTSELRKLQVDMLDYFDAFCRRNQLRYWLDYGTLLGAIRHKGFIPWDDDVDIAMLREDYERAARLFNDQSEGRYLFQTPFNNSVSCYPFGKLVDTATVLYEYGEEGIQTGVYVDVFVYDNSPDDAMAVKRMFRRRDFLGRVRRLKLPIRKEVRGIKKAAYVLGSAMLRPVSSNAINRALDRNARRYQKADTRNVSAFADPYDANYFAADRRIFEQLEPVEFEGRHYPAPARYDEWLTVLYGNYMQLPPIEKRVRQHAFEAYYKEQ